MNPRQLHMDLLGIVVTGGSPEDLIRRLLRAEAALQVHESNPNVEALLAVCEAHVLHGSFRHLPGLFQVAHLEMECHVTLK